MAYPYTVHNPAGEQVLQAPENCRSSRRTELAQLARKNGLGGLTIGNWKIETLPILRRERNRYK